MTFTPRFPQFLHGGDYNPDQWLHRPDILAQDIELMKKANVTTEARKVVAAAMARDTETGDAAAAMELPDGTIVTGRTSELLGASSALLLSTSKVNGKRAKENQMLEAGDVIELYIPDEFSKTEADTSEYDKIKASPVVVYEDENLIICDKKAGMLSHTGDKGENGAAAIAERDTLIFLIRAYLYKNGKYDPSDEASFAPALANRLDRNTGGLVIAAKNAEALRVMNEKIKNLI